MQQQPQALAQHLVHLAAAQHQAQALGQAQRLDQRACHLWPGPLVSLDCQVGVWLV